MSDLSATLDLSGQAKGHHMNTTLYIDYLLQVLAISEGSGPMYRWACAEMDAELRKYGFIE